MDTSVATWKAITEADKEKYRKEGQCSKCNKQGHIARNCPNKKACTCAAQTPDTSKTTSVTSEAFTEETTTTSIASQISKLTDEERDKLIMAMQGFEEGKEGFQDTWAIGSFKVATYFFTYPLYCQISNKWVLSKHNRWQINVIYHTHLLLSWQ